MQEFEFAAIIPFFQREPGILARAVASVFQQEGVAPPLLVVVDDASPVDAAEELAPFMAAYPDNIVLLRQENQGPGAARNTALDYASPKAKYIAFLDSDDIWKKRHLATAKRALDEGCDFYFCDALHRNGAHGVFVTKNFPPSGCRPIDNAQNLFEFEGDFVETIVTASPICTPCVVFRAEAFALRFEGSLRTAAEDLLLWLEMAGKRKRTAFCTHPHVQLGYGENIYISAEYGSSEMLVQTYYNMEYAKRANALLADDARYRSILRGHMNDFRERFAGNFFAALVRGERKAALAVACRFFRLDPAALLWLPADAAARLRKRL